MGSSMLSMRLDPAARNAASRESAARAHIAPFRRTYWAPAAGTLQRMGGFDEVPLEVLLRDPRLLPRHASAPPGLEGRPDVLDRVQRAGVRRQVQQTEVVPLEDELHGAARASGRTPPPSAA